MRLSEAIRLGAMLKPQGFGWFVDDDGNTCALGSALDALGRLSSQYMELDRCVEIWPIITDLRNRPCPVCINLDEAKNWSIPHLNDDHRWTREQIADWVETIESARQPASEEATSTNAVAGTVETPQAVTSRI